MPAQAGLPAGGDRRTPGLRREELALLAGVSVDYVVRLEQGRARRPSASVLAALARALRLPPGEQELLYRLAGSVRPPSGEVPRTVPRSVQLMLDRMSDTPLAVFTAAWDAVQWNSLWVELLGDPALLDGRARNLIWRHFAAGSGGARVERDTAHTRSFEREIVADLRRAAERYPDDRAVTELIGALRASNPRFEDLWIGYHAAPASPSRKTIIHPALGPITLDCDVLTIDGSDLRIVLYSAEPGSRDERLLDRLRTASTDRRAPSDSRSDEETDPAFEGVRWAIPDSN